MPHIVSSVYQILRPILHPEFRIILTRNHMHEMMECVEKPASGFHPKFSFIASAMFQNAVYMEHKKVDQEEIVNYVDNKFRDQLQVAIDTPLPLETDLIDDEELSTVVIALPPIDHNTDADFDTPIDSAPSTPEHPDITPSLDDMEFHASFHHDWPDEIPINPIPSSPFSHIGPQSQTFSQPHSHVEVPHPQSLWPDFSATPALPPTRIRTDWWSDSPIPSPCPSPHSEHTSDRPTAPCTSSVPPSSQPNRRPNSPPPRPLSPINVQQQLSSETLKTMFPHNKYDLDDYSCTHHLAKQKMVCDYCHLYKDKQHLLDGHRKTVNKARKHRSKCQQPDYCNLIGNLIDSHN